MRKPYLIFFSTLMTLMSHQASSQLADFDKGFRLPLETIETNFSLMNLSPSQELIKKYIVKSNFKIPSADAQIIAHEIITSSACLGLDPWIMTGLIKKESSFNHKAVSATGAAGLTQFTSIGLKEVNDQLGVRGREGAPEAITLYLAGKIRTCIDSSWIDLWNRTDLKDDHPDYYNRLKEELKNDPKTAVVYGTILLKVYLSVVTVRTNFVIAPPKKSELYYQALQIYNGEEGEAKVKYAKQIFKYVKEMYPKDVDFPY